MVESDYIPYEALERMGPGRVMVFAPHPDDEVFGCGGALIQHVLDGDPVQVVVATDGSRGGDLEDLAEIRMRESLEAASLIGYPAPIFLGYPDRGLISDDGLVSKIQALVEGFGAEIIYAPSSSEIHPDHYALSAAVLKALSGMGRTVSLLLYEVGVPLSPNRLLDITLHQGLKWRAMGVFKSQLLIQDYRRHIEALNNFRTYTLGPGVRGAEAFRWVSIGGGSLEVTSHRGEGFWCI